MFKRILLVNPDGMQQCGFTPPPLGLAYLAGALKDADISFGICDGSLDGRQGILHTINRFQPDIIGVTCLTLVRHNVWDLCSDIKKHYPDIKIVIGGVHPSLMPQQVLDNYMQVDYVVVGEGEQTLVELMQMEHPSHVRGGLCFRDGNMVVIDKSRKYVKNIDDISYPAWEYIDIKRYPALKVCKYNGYNGVDLNQEPRVGVIFSRGCTGGCTFCSTTKFWKGYRNRSAENMVGELDILINRHGVRHFIFADDLCTYNQDEFGKFCKLFIKEGLHKRTAWFATTRPDCVSLGLLRDMKAASCYGVSYGIESGSPEVLKRLNKEFTVEQAANAIDWTTQVGMRPVALMMYNTPGETTQDKKSSEKFLQEHPPTGGVGSVNNVWVLVGTKLERRAITEGKMTEDFWLGTDPYYIWKD